ncbi:phosphomannomutase/phosphoglucomutase [Flindersiella endophytica]
MPDLESVLSEIIKAYDIRGVVPDQLSTDIAYAVGAAFVEILERPESVVVGHDMRTSSPELAAAFIAGATAQGANVIDIGLASTDLLYFASGKLEQPGAMITASHNPAQYGGIKLCRAGAAPVGRDTGLEQIRSLLQEGLQPATGPAGTVEQRDLLADYADHLKTLVDLSGIRRLKVAADAGNGMAGHTVPKVLDGLNVELVPMYFELDGTFPHHEANPIEPANLVDLQAKVRETQADIGLAFDGDADRCWVLDERGESVSPSAITALIAVRELAKEPGAKIIHNLITSRAVPEIVRENGGEPIRERVGHSFIKATMAETGAIFGGEHSAHFYFRDFWRADSGMLAALHTMAALGGQDKPLSELLREYTRYAASGEINTRVDDQAGAMARVKETFAGRDGVTVDELDGLTIEHADWWFNLRPSNTEPVLRLNAEASDGQTMEQVRDEVLGLLK